MKTKQCTKCKEWKDENEFHKDRSRKDGLFPQCKCCCNKRRREWGKNNKQHTSKYHEQWRENNQEHLAEYHKDWRKDNQEHLTEYFNQWKQDNRDHLAEYSHKYNSQTVLYTDYPHLYDSLWYYENVSISEDGYIICKCSYCPNYFKPTMSQIRNRVNFISGVIDSENRFYCSQQCKDECLIYNKKSHREWDDVTCKTFFSYISECRKLTERTYNRYKKFINPYDLNRGKEVCDYQLDHKFSIISGFENDIHPKVISCKHNLEMLTVKDNNLKNGKCSITEEELYELY